MRREIVGFKKNNNWITVYTLCPAPSVTGLKSETFNFLCDERVAGIDKLAVGNYFDVVYGCSFSGKAFLEHVEFIEKNRKEEK